MSSSSGHQPAGALQLQQRRRLQAASQQQQERRARITFGPPCGGLLQQQEQEQAAGSAQEAAAAQLALAHSVMAGLQLAAAGGASAVSHSTSSNASRQRACRSAPFAHVQLPPLQLLPAADVADARAAAASSQQQQSPAMQQQADQQPRRFPFIMLQQQQQQQPSQQQQQQPPQQQPDRNKLRTRQQHENPASMPGLVCLEADAGGRQRAYRVRRGVDGSSGKSWEGFDMVRRCAAARCSVVQRAACRPAADQRAALCM